MTISAHLPTSVGDRDIGLEVWMGRVLDLCPKIQPEWNPGKVHDLRVALRRTRTMARALEAVNPAPGWHKIRKSSGELFHVLGDLRIFR